MDKKRYAKLIKEKSPHSKTVSDVFRAFAFGGGICAYSEMLFEVFDSSASAFRMRKSSKN